MAGDFITRQDELRRVKWLSLFSDREGPRGRIASFLRNLRDPYSKLVPILHFYGVSGQGKTALFRKTKDELTTLDHENVRFGFLPLEHLQQSLVDQPIEVLWHITCELGKAGIATPLTLCLYVHYWKRQNAGQEIRLTSQPLKDAIDRWTKGSDVVSKFGESAKDLFLGLSAGLKTLALVNKCWIVARDRAREIKIAEIADSDPSDWDLERIERSFPEFLCYDILDHLRSNPSDKVCLVVDTIERLRPERGKSDACERLFQNLCNRLIDAISTDSVDDTLRNRVGFLLFGREALDWSAYDRPSTWRWENYIESHKLDGFGEAEARKFLTEEYPAFWAARKLPEIGEELKRCQDQIMAASREREDPHGPPTYLPYFLRLSGEMIYAHGRDFRPELFFGTTPAEMQERFLMYLRDRSPERLRAMQCLALAGRFDRELFQHLVEKHFIQGVPIHAFLPDLIVNRCYIDTLEGEGSAYFQFHRHMQRVLLDDLARAPGEVEAAAECIKHILKFYFDKIHIEQPADFSAELHTPAYVAAMETLITNIDRGWVAPVYAEIWRSIFTRRIGTERMIATQLALNEQILERWLKHFGKDHAAVASVLATMARLLETRGYYGEAESFTRRVVAVYESAFREDDEAITPVLVDLGKNLMGQHRWEEALSTFERVRAIVGESPDKVVQIEGHISGALAGSGRYPEAIAMMESLIEKHKHVEGPDYRLTTALMGNLAHMYTLTGRFEDATSLYSHVMPISLQFYGPDHPFHLDLIGNYAYFTARKGDRTEAISLFERLISTASTVMGPEHPLVRKSRSAMANLQAISPVLLELRAIPGRKDHPRVNILNTGQATKAPSSPKSGRNQICPCGSGKKYKKCCGA